MCNVYVGVFVPWNYMYAWIYNYITNRNTSYICHCASGYRSTIATSLLNRLGFKVQDIYGGFAAISVFNPELTTSGQVCMYGFCLLMDKTRSSFTCIR